MSDDEDAVEPEGRLAIDYVLKLRKEAEVRKLEEVKSRDVDGSLTALYKIHSLIPDVSNMPEEELLDMCVKSVIYNTDDLIVLNKPYGLSVTNGPLMGTTIEKLLSRLQQIVSPKSHFLEPAHRIDRCTTGLLMLAASRLRLTELRDLFRQKEVTKSYLCITKMVPNPPSGVIKVPIGQKKMGQMFKIIPLLINEGEKKGKLRRYRNDARLVETNYEVVKEGQKCAFVKCTSQSGAKHQIRSHLGLSLGTPILGDHKYSSFFGQKPQKLPIEMLHKLDIRGTKSRHLPMYLHASEIEIPCFRDRLTLRLRADLPKFFIQALMQIILLCYESSVGWLERAVVSDFGWQDYDQIVPSDRDTIVKQYNNNLRPRLKKRCALTSDGHLIRSICLPGMLYRRYLAMWQNSYTAHEHLIPRLCSSALEAPTVLWVLCRFQEPTLQLDIRGGLKIMAIVYSRLELERNSWYLSTLGGAFSAYGEYFEDYAVKAMTISTVQLRLAIRLGNTFMISRCHLYYALSLIQQGRLRRAKRIIKLEYGTWEAGKSDEAKVIRNICHGLWSRLKWEKRRRG